LAIGSLRTTGRMAESQGDGAVMRIGRRCFVSNLNWKTSWQDLKDKFRESGEVVYANVVRDDDGRSKGWGIVEFDTPEAAVNAVQTFNGTELAGRKILVREDREDRDVKQYNKENGIEAPERAEREPRAPRRERRNRDGQNGGPRDGGDPRERREPRETVSSGLQVVIQGIPWAFTDDDLGPLFEGVGEVTHAEVQIGKDGRSRGYGTVGFSSVEEATAAIEKVHGTELEGRTLTVKLDRFA
jgi:RNA recognition motif-containing protein